MAEVIIQEVSVPTTQLFVGSGRVAYAVYSEKGIANDYMFVTNEDELVKAIGSPKVLATSQHFHACKDVLSYSNDMVIRRAIPSDAQMGRIGLTETGSEIQLNNGADVTFINDFELHTIATNLANHPTLKMEFYAKEAMDATYQSLKVAVCKPDYTQTGSTVWGDNTDTADGTNKFSDNIQGGPQTAKDEIALCVLVDDVPTEWWVVSLTDGNKNDVGENSYITDYLISKSSYVVGYVKSSIYSTVTSFQAKTLALGSKGTTPTTGDFETAYNTFADKDAVSFDYLMDGFNYANRGTIQTIVDNRKDCDAFINCKYSDCVGITNSSTILSNIIADRLALTNSSRVCYFSNWKQMYDKYFDKQIWIPSSADFAGNKCKVNANAETWTPAAGTEYGLMQNVTKLAWQPNATQQKELIKYQINPVFNKKGKGFLFDGQMTMWSLNVGVSRLNIREVLRVSENYVAGVAVDFLHKFNNPATQQRFVNLVEPFFKDILNRGGITRYRIVADSSINTPAVVDSFQFRARIFLTGSRPIETFIVTFYEVGSSISFDEVAAAGA